MTEAKVGCGEGFTHSSHQERHTCARVYVTTGRVSVSMDKKEPKAAEWLLWVRVTEASARAT